MKPFTTINLGLRLSLKKHGTELQISAAKHSNSNSLAEMCCKRVRRLMNICPKSTLFYNYLDHYNSLPHDGELSPNSRFLGIFIPLDGFLTPAIKCNIYYSMLQKQIITMIDRNKCNSTHKACHAKGVSFNINDKVAIYNEISRT